MQGIIKIGIECDDWKQEFDFFIENKHLIQEDNTYKLGKMFDYLEDHNPEEQILESAISCITGIGKDLIPAKLIMTMTLPEQVQYLLDKYKEILCKKK